MIKVDCPTLLVVPESLGGVAETWYQILSMATRGVRVVDHPGERSTFEVSRALFDLQSANVWASLGSDVYGFELYYELSDVLKTCPFSNPDNPEPWSTYGVADNGSHAPIQIDGKYYRSNKRGNAGTQIVGTQDSGIEFASWPDWVLQPDVARTGVVRLLTVEEFQQLQG